MTDDQVTVVVPAWNAARYIGAAIESVLSQSLPPAEVIVVDDGSSDTTGDVASRYPVRLIRQANSGAGAARNVGVGASASPLLAFLDADDLWLPGKQVRQLSALRETGADAVFGLARNFVSPDRVDELGHLRVDSTVRAAYLPSALLVRRAVFDAVGPFATEGALTDWVDWYLRLVELPAQIHVVDMEVVARRVHGDNATLLDPAAKTAYGAPAQGVTRSPARPRAVGVSPEGNDHLTTCAILTSRVISEVVDNEAIIIDSLTGAYFTLDPFGTRLWGLLCAGSQNVEALNAAAEGDTERVTGALSELHAAGLIEVDGPLPDAGSGHPPVLTKYSDMEELLLLDPIHDVDDAGWPVLPKDG